MEDWQQRVQEEHDQLVERHFKLGAFMQSDQFSELSELDQTLLETQWMIMATYGNILEKRIERFED